jgi:hypothetical protein
MGHEGTLVLSEKAARCRIYRESWVPEGRWEPWLKKGYLGEPVAAEPKPQPAAPTAMDVRDTVAPPAFHLPVTTDKPVHQAHLENFFDAIRGRAKLNCPAEVGYETAVTVLKVNEAVEAGRRLEFGSAEFQA